MFKTMQSRSQSSIYGWFCWRGILVKKINKNMGSTCKWDEKNEAHISYFFFFSFYFLLSSLLLCRPLRSARLRALLFRCTVYMYLLNIHARVLAHHRFSFLSFLENLCRWRIDGDDIPMETHSSLKPCLQMVILDPSLWGQSQIRGYPIEELHG